MWALVVDAAYLGDRTEAMPAPRSRREYSSNGPPMPPTRTGEDRRVITPEHPNPQLLTIPRRVHLLPDGPAST